MLIVYPRRSRKSTELDRLKARPTPEPAPTLSAEGEVEAAPSPTTVCSPRPTLARLGRTEPPTSTRGTPTTRVSSRPLDQTETDTCEQLTLSPLRPDLYTASAQRGIIGPYKDLLRREDAPRSVVYLQTADNCLTPETRYKASDTSPYTGPYHDPAP